MTNQSLAKRGQVMPTPVWTAEQIEIIKATVAVGVSDMELALFLQVAQSRGLDPFAKEIYAVMRWDSEAGKMKMVLQTGIDGYRKLAADSGEYAGQEGPYWCGPDGKWVDVWLKPEPPAAAKVGILRKGFDQPVWCIARWDAYKQTKKDGTLSKFWKTMGPEQLAKCAEAIGLRKAFPRQTAGLRTHEEMAQADNDVKAIRVEAQQAVVQEKLAQFRDAELPDTRTVDQVLAHKPPVGDGPMPDIVEDPLPPSTSPAAKGSGSSTIKAGDVMVSGGTVGIATPAPRPAADPRLGKYLYPEQAEHLKLFAKAKKAIGSESYYRCLRFNTYEKSTQIRTNVEGECILVAMREIAAAQAKTRKLKSDQAKAEMDAASLLPSREGSGCPIHIANQIATCIKKLGTPWEEANRAMQSTMDKFRKESLDADPAECWTVILLGLQDVLKRREQGQ